MNIPISSIIIPERLRLDYGGAKFERLKQSLEEYGQLQAITLNHDMTLIAGGRRLAAMTELGWETCEAFVLGDIPKSTRLAMELEENIRRLDMTWQEKVLAIEEVHRWKKADDPGTTWGVRETGELLDMDFSLVAKCNKVAVCLRQGDKADKEMWSATSMADALRIIVMRREQKAAEKLARMEKAMRESRARERHAANGGGGGPIGPLTSQLEKMLGGGDPDGEPDPGVPPSNTVIDITGHYVHADCLEWMRASGPQCFDHVVTDIPYGIDMGNLDDMVDIHTVINEHDVEENIAMFEPFIKEAYRLLRPNGFCVFWYDLVHHELLRGLCTRSGFRVQNWPLVWIKTHQCKNNAPDQNWTKSTEFAMVCRKGNASLVEKQSLNYVSAGSTEARKRYAHPFVKPDKVWKFIYDAIAMPGQSVLDPFAGVSSSALAAIPLGLQPTNIEISKHHHDRAIQHVTHLYREIYRGRVEFV